MFKRENDQKCHKYLSILIEIKEKIKKHIIRSTRNEILPQFKLKEKLNNKITKKLKQKIKK